MNLFYKLRLLFITLMTIVLMGLLSVLGLYIYYNLTTYSFHVDNMVILVVSLIAILLVTLFITGTSNLLVKNKLVKKENINKYILIVFIILITAVSFQSNNLINYFVKSDYESLNNNILKNKNVENSQKYKEFLVSMKENNKEKLNEYLNRNSFARINDNFISITDDQNMLLLMAARNISLDPNISKEIDKVLDDGFVSIAEYKDLRSYIINKKETYPEVAYLMRTEK